MIAEVGVGATPKQSPATAGGDGRKLRGIPVLAFGVGSAMLGTNPEAALIAKERRRRA